jgi:hypothetical protein
VFFYNAVQRISSDGSPSLNKTWRPVSAAAAAVAAAAAAAAAAARVE